MQLGKHAIDEFQAKNGAPAGQLHEGRVCTTRNSSKRNKECKPSTGYGHRLKGEMMRGVTGGGTSLGKGRGGRHEEIRRGGGVHGYRCSTRSCRDDYLQY
eukprot:6213963-Pleurochrysis_carterae.AAC.3